jgi:phage terminase small subunit
MPRKKRLPAVIEKATEASGLTDKQQRFCELFAETGQKTQSAIDAGYAADGAAVEAWRLLRNPRIQQELQQQVRERFVQHAPAALGTIVELAQSAKSGMVRLLAAQDLLDRAGFKPVERQMHAVAGELKVTIDLG